MGVTSGGLANGETQDITIEIPGELGDTAGDIEAKLQELVDAFNSDYGANTVEIL